MEIVKNNDKQITSQNPAQRFLTDYLIVTLVTYSFQELVK